MSRAQRPGIRIQGGDNYGRLLGSTSGGVMVPQKAEWHAIDPVTLPPDGVAVGGVWLQSGAGGVVHIEDLEFKASASPFSFGGFDLPFLSVAGGLGVAAVRDDEVSVSRREALAGGAALLGLGAVATEAAAEETTLTVIEFKVTENPRGLHVELVGSVGSILPPDRRYQLLHEGTVRDEFSPNSPAATLHPGRTGTVEILTPADKTIWHELQAMVPGDSPVSYQVTLPQPASQYDVGAEVTVASDSALVQPVKEAGGSETVVALGDMSIPHKSERALANPGVWFVSDGALIYRVGEDAPDQRAFAVAAGVSSVREMQDDLSRGLGR